MSGWRQTSLAMPVRELALVYTKRRQVSSTGYGLRLITRLIISSSWF